VVVEAVVKKAVKVAEEANVNLVRPRCVPRCLMRKLHGKTRTSY
jgi:hypothetical protein